MKNFRSRSRGDEQLKCFADFFRLPISTDFIPHAACLRESETKDPEYVRGLQELADKYECDALTHLLQEAAGGS
jgi:hypothetical protein